MTELRLLDYWSPPPGAGSPIACLATTFTFESDFFAQDCLARFLSLSTVASEGDRISTIAAVLEEEDRLNEVQVSVLIDRSSSADKRNLRWDVLPVAVQGGLLHAKTAVLVWENAARVILGSANLTSAGYRRQVEAAIKLDIAAGSAVPRDLLDEFATEIRRLVGLVPGPTAAAKARAFSTIELFEERIAATELPTASSRTVRLALAPARPGLNPLLRMKDVWKGPQPLSACVLSPFWDEGAASAAIKELRNILTGRPASERVLMLVTPRNPFDGRLSGGPELVNQGASVNEFEPPTEEPRALHAKVYVVESSEWLAAMVGSSNATTAGLGLNRRGGHHELNVWIGCPADSTTARQLRSLTRAGSPIDRTGTEWESAIDEDEPVTPQLPMGFVTCIVDGAMPARVELTFDATALPPTWRVRTPTGHQLVDSNSWQSCGSHTQITYVLSDDVLPSYLDVDWQADGDTLSATWAANIADRSVLPPPAELAELDVDVLLAALASSRPLPVALEAELRRGERRALPEPADDLDPLRRFDDSGFLLQRTRHFSLALAQLETRLSRPTSSPDALKWRLFGPLGPRAIAEGLVRAASKPDAIAGEAHFLLAELALTVGNVDWRSVENAVGRTETRAEVQNAIASIRELINELPAAPDEALASYVHEALSAARQ